MNKKEYIAPRLQIVPIETQALLAASGDQTFGISGEEVNSGWADARYGFFEDDDEDLD